MFYKNVFQMTGIVVSKAKRDDKSTYFTIVTHSGAEAYVGCVDFGSHDDVSIMDHVSVTGHIEGTPYRDKEGKIKTSQYFIIDTMEKEKTAISSDFGFEGGNFYRESTFSYLLAGKVTYVREQGRFLELSVETENAAGKAALINLSVTKRRGMPEIKKGDNIACVCGVYTKNRGFRNITISDVALVPESATA